MKIKVCGMKHPENIKSLAKLPIDIIGFIFYPHSPRYAASLDPGVLSEIPLSIQKVGVFVNETTDRILEIVKQYHLQAIQLHGNESPEQCRLLKNEGCTVIKAFNVATPDDFEQIIPYEAVCDYYLFDSKTSKYGGSGVRYDWDILKNYTGKRPFILSGGIGPDDAEQLHQIKHPMLYAIDLNSRFEAEPGEKNIEMLVKFFNRLLVYSSTRLLVY